MADEFPFALLVEGKWDPGTACLKNKLTIYFQSKKSNGGDCDVEYEDSDGQRARVRFKAEEVRQNVLEKQWHEIKLGNDILRLNVYLPPTEAKLNQETKSSFKTGQTEESSNKDEKPTTSKSQTKEVKDVEPSEDSKESSRTSAVIKKLQNFNAEFLNLLVENVLSWNYEDSNYSVEVLPERDRAVITFTNNKDAEHFIKCCPNNSIFKRKNLEISPLEMTTKVKVEDISSDLNSDYLLLYFEKYGEIDVEMLDGDESAVITFKTHAVANTVLEKQHYIKKHPIRLFPYYESLGVALYGKEGPPLKLPESFIVKIDPYIWKYLQDHNKTLNIITLDMQKYFCHLEFQNQAVSIHPLSSILQQGVQTKNLLQTWREKSSAEFMAIMSKYKSLKIKIERDAWAELEAEVRRMLSFEPVTLILHEVQGSMIVAGLAEDVNRTGNVVQSIVVKIAQRIQQEKNRIKDELSITPSVCEILVKDGLLAKICSTFPELKLNYDASSQKLTLFGMKQDILESKNQILQEAVNLKRGMIALDAPILQFLMKKDIEELTKKLFLSNGLCASLEIEKNQVFIVAKTEKILKDSEAQLKAQLYHVCIDVDDPAVFLETEWNDLVHRLSDAMNSPIMTMLINKSDRQVVISGFAESVQLVHKQLDDYIQINSPFCTTLQAEKIIVNFIKEHKKEDWCEFGRNKVKISFVDDTVLLSGPRLQVSKCKIVFEKLLSSVYCTRIELDNPGTMKVFQNKELSIVETAKSKMGCVIELLGDKQASSRIIGRKRVRTPDGVEIIVSKGDMCLYPVDAIVYATNNMLYLNSGLSKALSDAAGPEQQEACNQIIKKQTQAGGLQCKYVIHAVWPQYDSSNPQKVVSALNNAVKMSLKLAEREYCQSVAILAISSGSLRFPPGLCADTIVSALNEFLELKKGDTHLKVVHLIDKNEKTIEAFEAAMQKLYEGSFTSQGPTLLGSPISQHKNPKQSSFSNQGSSQSFTTNEGLTITLEKCNIQDTSLDVVVNSVSADLVLNHGAIAQAILAAAGPQIQTLLSQQATGPASIGAIFVTKGCNLKTKLVFHAVAPHWNQGKGSSQMQLESIMDGSLNLAEQHKQRSIVFPAIGTGNLGFPKTLVATIMLDSILKFSKNRVSRHVQEVMIAVHPSDQPTIQAFTDEFNKKFNIQSSLASGPSNGSGSLGVSLGPFSNITSPKTGIYETSMGGVVLKVLSGDITKETTDVIVNSTNENFTLKLGVSKAILDSAGPNVEAECLQLGALPNDGLIMTQHGNLSCKKIIHISARNDLKTIQQRVKRALELCAKNKFTSISFPAFGTGQGGINSGHVADHMLDGVIDFLKQTPRSSLQTVHIVIFQAPMLADFYQSMLRRNATEGKKNDRDWSRHTALTKSLFMSNKPNNNVAPTHEADFLIQNKMPTVCFSICGPSKSAVDETEQFLVKIISDEQASQFISDSMILRLSDKDRKRIQDLQRTMQVKIERKAQAAAAVNSDEVTLVVEGISKDVLAVVSEINSMLKQTRDRTTLENNIKITSGLVEWQYQQGGQFLSFDPATNHQLEGAFNEAFLEVDINFQKQVYKVRIPEGPAVSASGKQMGIRRVDKTNAGEKLPKEWDVMTSELQKVCLLQPNSQEYNNVLGQFKTTCGRPVLKIERIQNLRMWKNYQNNKQFMEQLNGHQNNEKMLFHGTREDSIKHINQNGFNRSYAGKNAAVYGKGTYFAVNASYSANDTYSEPNAQGTKHMYYCRVLTGDYTFGNSAMIDPPAKSANGTNLYDTVVDNIQTPTIFVVFRDYHAYPDYLITFA